MKDPADEAAARARLLAHYEQRERELTAKLEQIRATLVGLTGEAEIKAKIQLGRARNLAEDYRAKAARLRDTLPR